MECYRTRDQIEAAEFQLSELKSWPLWRLHGDKRRLVRSIYSAPQEQKTPELGVGGTQTVTPTRNRRNSHLASESNHQGLYFALSTRVLNSQSNPTADLLLKTVSSLPSQNGQKWEGKILWCRRLTVEAVLIFEEQERRFQSSPSLATVVPTSETGLQHV
ncbi:hypothetical protein SprV_0802523400 [Sparganum proliferum]